MLKDAGEGAHPAADRTNPKPPTAWRSSSVAADGTWVVLRGSPGHRHWYRTTSSGKAKTVCGKLIDCGGRRGGHAHPDWD